MSELEIEKCQCGGDAGKLKRVPLLENGYVIKCSREVCPATVQRKGKLETIESWNTMSLRTR